jgi:hypothetical protein
VIPIIVPGGSSDLLTAYEWWVANHKIETGAVTRKDLWKSYRPMEWPARRRAKRTASIKSLASTSPGILQRICLMSRPRRVNERSDALEISAQELSEGIRRIPLTSGRNCRTSYNICYCRQNGQYFFALTMKESLAFNINSPKRFNRTHGPSKGKSLIDHVCDGAKCVTTGRPTSDRDVTSSAHRGVVVEIPQLVDVPHAEQTVPCFKCMIEEREGSIFRYRGQPHRELCHLDCHRVPVYAVATAFGDKPACSDDAF